MRLKIARIILIILCFISFSTHLSPIYADTTLIHPDDQVTSVFPSATQIEHLFRFTIPPSGVAVAVSDLIVIKMPFYSSFDLSRISVYGNFVYGANSDGSEGNLHASISANTITLTNISIVGGAGISIGGIIAQNPNYTFKEAEEVDIMNAAGDQIKYLARIQPSEASPFAVNASATFKPPTATIVLNGVASPNDFIQVYEGASILGTVTPDGTGVFQSTLSGLHPGLHTLTLFGMDANNNLTARTSVILFAPIYQTTTYSNLVLSPIITLSSLQVHQADTLTISGETVPNSTITISLNSPLIQFNTTSDAAGNFSFADNQIGSMTPGQYLASATVQTPASVQSVSSIAIAFTVLSNISSGGGGPQPTCDISHGDLNCDHTVDIFDFSILLYNWGQIVPLRILMEMEMLIYLILVL